MAQARTRAPAVRLKCAQRWKREALLEEENKELREDGIGSCCIACGLFSFVFSLGGGGGEKQSGATHKSRAA